MSFDELLQKTLKADKSFFVSAGEPEWRLPSGIPSLDNILGGGIPSGSFVQIYGPTGSGKTTIASTFLGNAIKAGYTSTYVHVEEFDKFYMQACGVDTEAENFTYWSNDYAEKIFNLIRKGFVDEDLKVAVIDSLGFMSSRKIIDKEQVEDKGDKEASIAVNSRLMADFMRKIKQPLFRKQGILIATNHMTTEIGGWKPRQIAAGGLKLQYGTSLRFRLFSKAIPATRSIETTVTIDKSKDKLLTPWASTVLDIIWREGIDKVADLVRICKLGNVIEQRGAWAFYGDMKFQGTDALKEAIRTDDALREELTQRAKEIVLQSKGEDIDGTEET